MAFDSFLNFVFSPLMKLPPLWVIIILSLILSIVVTYVYKWMTNQILMKSMKDEMKKHQEDMKKEKDNHSKVLEIQKKAMDVNMKYMLHSMKPTLITFIPLILIFGWMTNHLAYEPIKPGMEFTTTVVFNENASGKVTLNVPEQIQLISKDTQNILNGLATWSLKGEKGEYLLEYSYQDQKFSKELLITDDYNYKKTFDIINKDGVKEVRIDNKPLKPLNLFGWQIGWLGTYIIFSLIFSIGLRKLLKIY